MAKIEKGIDTNTPSNNGRYLELKLGMLMVGIAFGLLLAYLLEKADAFALFSLDENGKAQRIKMKGISRFIDFSFDFQDLDLKRISKSTSPANGTR